MILTVSATNKCNHNTHANHDFQKNLKRLSKTGITEHITTANVQEKGKKIFYWPRSMIWQNKTTVN